MMDPEWNASSHWFRSAVNKELRAPEKHLLEKTFHKVEDSKPAKAVFLEVADRLRRSVGLSETTLLEALAHDARWETAVELCVLDLKRSELVPSQRDLFRWARSVLRMLLKPENASKIITHIGSAGVAVPAAALLTLHLADDTGIRIPVSLNTAKDQQFQVGIGPRLDSKGVALPIQFDLRGVDGHGPGLTVPVQFETSGAAPLKLNVDPTNNVGPNAAAPCSQNCKDAQSLDASILQLLQELKTQESKNAPAASEIEAAISGVKTELHTMTELEKEEEQHGKVVSAELAGVSTTAQETSTRLQPVSVLLPEQSTREVPLPYFGEDGHWSFCTLKLTSAKLNGAGGVTFDPADCPKGTVVSTNRPLGGVQGPYPLQLVSPASIVIGKTTWKINLDRENRPWMWFQPKSAEISLSSFTKS